MLQAAEEGTTTRRHLLVHHEGKKAFLPIAAGHKRCLCGVFVCLWLYFRQKSCQNGSEEPWQVVMFPATEESRKPLESSAHLPQGKIPSWPQDWWSAFPLACDQDLPPHPTAFWSCLPGNAQALFSLKLKPSRGLPRWTNCHSPDQTWGQESFPSIVGATKCWDPWKTILDPISYGCCLWLHGVWEQQALQFSSDRSIQEGIPLVLPLLPHWKGATVPGTSRGWWFSSLEGLAWSRFPSTRWALKWLLQELALQWRTSSSPLQSSPVSLHQVIPLAPQRLFLWCLLLAPWPALAAQGGGMLPFILSLWFNQLAASIGSYFLDT